ncbi:LysR family transcriptional regulator (plasmid) [Deinococcus metallilatus]|uniref:DNA-binding transcriptional LysR family regulator n=1 Tax=Deinococcus metallilatus TaxID=1211322 RepID=A0ABR6N0B0_9DEIO|nr:LysR family transcriptional regulator [Deinococcus metallilatus]MBB5296936.1 DNA-binding transcriptional LysR family regulator [Deinococcus metallilatus]QBY06696.1 LysR family transcriptional regulator [Deinococcus metallilatus]GMA15165.1 hypothetical protein GCM10025871_14960 [Deinococcus metallilatus]
MDGQLQAPQEQIGQPLYTGRVRGMVLNDIGERLLPYAQAMNRNVREVADLFSDLRKRSAGRVSVALSARAIAVVRQATSGS